MPPPFGSAPPMGGMSLPKSPMGGPPGPGTSPALSPGAGAGNEAAASADILEAIPMLTKHLNSFPIGDKRRQALMRAVTALEAHFGKSVDEALRPAAITKMARAAQSGQSQPHTAPPPGMTLGGPHPMGAMGGGAMTAGPPGGGMGGGMPGGM